MRYLFRATVGRRRFVVELEGLDPASRAVWVVQERLRALGLLESAEGVGLRGSAGFDTCEAIRRFERLAGLPVTGDPHAPAMRIILREQVRAAQAAGRMPANVP